MIFSIEYNHLLTLNQPIELIKVKFNIKIKNNKFTCHLILQIYTLKIFRNKNDSFNRNLKKVLSI